MKALSIRQPWAWAIVRAGKRVENRTWPTPHRGPLLLHAAAGLGRDEYERAAAVIRDLAPAARLPAFGALERGGIVGRCHLVDCVRASPSPWFCGPVGLVLAEVEALPFTPLRGQLGLFEVDERRLAAPPGADGRQGALL